MLIPWFFLKNPFNEHAVLHPGALTCQEDSQTLGNRSVIGGKARDRGR